MAMTVGEGKYNGVKNMALQLVYLARYRLNDHTHSIRQKKLLPLSLHFNADDHSINDLKVCILKVNFKDTKQRKLTELQFIINF